MGVSYKHRVSAASRSAKETGDDVMRKAPFESFGSSETFIDAWRTRGHAWRLRAVISLFLAALLFTMMPGTGTTLYRNWAFADSGDDGLLAIGGADLDAEDVAMEASATGDGERYIYDETKGYTYDSWSGTYKPDGSDEDVYYIRGEWDNDKKAFKFLELDADNKISYYPSIDYAPPVIWGVESNDKHNNTVIIDAYSGTDFYRQNGTYSGLDSIPGLSKGRGQLGEVFPGYGESSLQIPYTTNLTGQQAAEKSHWWIIGHDQTGEENWNYGMTSVMTKPPTGQSEGYLRWNNVLDTSDPQQIMKPGLKYPGNETVIPYTDRYGATNNGGTLGINILHQKDGKYLHSFAFGVWDLSKYHVLLKIPYDEAKDEYGDYIVDEDGNYQIAYMTYLDTDDLVWPANSGVSDARQAITWDKSFDAYVSKTPVWNEDTEVYEYSGSNVGYSEFLEGYYGYNDINSEINWDDVYWRSITTAGNLTENGFRGKSGTLWELVNYYEDSKDASVDPHYPGSPFYAGNDATETTEQTEQKRDTVTAYPYFAIEYNANGGSGGLHQWAALQIASAKNHKDGSEGWEPYFNETGGLNSSWDDWTDEYWDSENPGYGEDDPDSPVYKALGYLSGNEGKSVLTQTAAEVVNPESRKGSDGKEYSYTFEGWTTVDPETDSTIQLQDDAKNDASAEEIRAWAQSHSSEFISASAISSAAAPDSDGILDSSITYYAVWSAKGKEAGKATVNVTVDGGTLGGQTSYNLSVDDGTALNAVQVDGTALGSLTATPADGYSASSTPWTWAGDATGGPAASLPNTAVEAGKTYNLTYSFEPLKYTVTVNVAKDPVTNEFMGTLGGGTSYTISNVEHGTKLNAIMAGETLLDQLEKSGNGAKYGNEGTWSWTTTGTDASANGTGTTLSGDVSVTGNTTLTFTFDIAKYTVTVAQNGPAAADGGGFALGGSNNQAGFTVTGVPYGTKLGDIKFAAATSGITAAYDASGTTLDNATRTPYTTPSTPDPKGAWSWARPGASADGSAATLGAGSDAPTITGNATLTYTYNVPVSYVADDSRTTAVVGANAVEAGVDFSQTAAQTTGQTLVTYAPYGSALNTISANYIPTVVPQLVVGTTPVVSTTKLTTVEGAEAQQALAIFNGSNVDPTKYTSWSAKIGGKAATAADSQITGPVEFTAAMPYKADYKLNVAVQGELGTVSYNNGAAQTSVEAASGVPWGAMANKYLDASKLTFKATDAGYGDSAEPIDDANDPSKDSSIVTGNMTYTYKLAEKATYNVSVSVVGGKVGNQSSFTVTGVPEGTAIKDIKVTESGGVLAGTSVAYSSGGKTLAELNYVPDDTHSYDATNAPGTWNPATTTTVTRDTSATFTFAAAYTLQVNVAKGGIGTKKASDSMTIVGIPANTKYTDIKWVVDGGVNRYKADGPNSLTSLQSNIKGNVGSDTGVWSGTNITGNPTSVSAFTDAMMVGTANSTITFTCDEGKVTVTYKLVNTVTDVKLDGATNVGDAVTKDLSYNSSYADAHNQAPALDASYDKNKYTGAITWTPASDASTLITDNNVTFTGTPVEKYNKVTLKVNGSWSATASDNADKVVYVKYGDNLANAKTDATGKTAATLPSVTNAKPPASGTYDAANGYWADSTGAEISGELSAQVPNAETTYTYTFPAQKVATFAISGGTWTATETYAVSPNADGEYVVPASEFTSRASTANPTVPGYVKADGTGEATWMQGSSELSTIPNTGVKITDDTTFTYTYAPFYKLTYQVVNGTWDGTDSADIVDYVKAGDPPTSAALTKAGGVRANTGFVGGADKWSPALPAASSTPTADATYVYTATAEQRQVRAQLYKLGVTGNSLKDETVEANYEEVQGGVSPLGEFDVNSTVTLTQANIDTLFSGYAENSGYEFVAANLDSIHGASAGSTLTVSATEADNVFKVYLKPKTFKVTYEWAGDSIPSAAELAEGSKSVPAEVTVPFGAEYTVAANSQATASYYQFSGWKKDGSVVTSFAMPAAPVKLIGTWTKDTVAITFVNQSSEYALDGQTDITYGDPSTAGKGVVRSVSYGGSVSAPGKDSSVGAAVDLSWKDADGNVVTPATTATEPKIYFANWVKAVSVTYTTNDTNALKKAFPAMSAEYAQGEEIPGLSEAPDSTDLVKDGYEFAGWQLNGTLMEQQPSNAQYPAGQGTTVDESMSGEVRTYTAVYQGKAHEGSSFTGDGVESGAFKETNKLGTDGTRVYTDTANARTGDKIYLPKADEYTKDHNKLTGYTVQVGDGTPTTVAPGSTYEVPATEGAIKIAAVFEPIAVAITYQHVLTPNQTNIPAVADQDGTALKTSANAGEQISLPNVTGAIPGYHFVEWTAMGTNPDYTFVDDDWTTGTKADPKEGEMTLHDSQNVAVKANWAQNKYKVKFELDSAYPNDLTNGFALNTEGESETANYTDSFASLTKPAANWRANSRAIKGYTTDIKWYVNSVADTNEVTSTTKISDILDKVPASALSDTEDDEGNYGTITFIGVPQPNAGFKVTVTVIGGTFQVDGVEKTTFQVTGQPYDASVKDIMTAAKVSNFAPNEAEGYAGGTWSRTPEGGDGLSVLETADTIDGDLAYVLTYTKNTYKVNYELASGFDDVALSKSSGTDGEFGAAITAPSATAVTLQPSTGSALTAAEVPFKYSGITWQIKKADNTVVDIPATAKFGDADYVIGTGDEKSITLVGTPTQKEYSIKIAVLGGTVKPFYSDDAASAVYTLPRKAHYGDKVSEYFDMNEFVFAVDGTNYAEPATWKDGKNPTLATTLVGSTDSDNTFTYEYSPLRTITFQLGHGTFKQDAVDNATAAGAVRAALSNGNRTLEYKVANGQSLNLPTDAIMQNDTGYGGAVSWKADPLNTIVMQNGKLMNITANGTYVFAYEAGKFGYTVNRFFQNANDDGYTAGTSESLEGSFDQVVSANDEALKTSEYGFVPVADHATNASGDPLEDKSITVGADSDANVINLYYNREKVAYTYSLGGITPSLQEAGVVQPAGGEAKYGQTIALAPMTDHGAYMFEGWCTDGFFIDLFDTYTFSSLTPVKFSGKYTAGSWKLTFKISEAAESDTNDPNAYFGTSSNPLKTTESLTTVDYETVPNPAIIPTVTSSNPDRWELDHWTYTTPTNSTPTVADKNLSNVTIMSSGYVFTPVFKLKTYTVTYTAGDHGTFTKRNGTTGEWELDAAGNRVNNTYKFENVPYGDPTPVPTTQNLKDIGSDSMGRPIKALGEMAYDYNNDTYGSEGLTPGRWPWAPAKAATVTGDTTYAYNWVERTFTVVFKDSVTGAEIARNSGAAADSTSGDAKITWNSSVYTETSNMTAAQAAALKDPSMAGYSFAGYSTGTSTASDNNVIAASLVKGDIKVSEAFSGNLNSGDSTLYLWRMWTGANAQIVFHANDGSDVTSTQVTTVGAKPQLKARSSMGSSFSRPGYEFKGWATTSTGNALYDDGSQIYEVKAIEGDAENKNDLYAIWEPITYSVQWTDLGSPSTKVTWEQVKTAVEADGGSFDIPDGVNASDPYTETLTYGEAHTLRAMSPVVESLPSANGNLVSKWEYNGTEVKDGKDLAAGEALTTTKGAIVVLTPTAAGKATLTFQDGKTSGTGTIAKMPAEDATAPVGSDGKATFKLPEAADQPTRAGYEFAGWKIGKTIYGEGGETVTVTSTNATAVAQWTKLPADAANAPTYTVKRYLEQTAGSGNYDAGTELPDGVKAQADTVVTDYTDANPPAGYTLNPSKSTTSLTVDADGNSVWELYYDKDSFTVNYVFSYKLADEETLVVPNVDTPTKVVEAGTTEKLPAYPTNLPEGYEVDTADKWVVNSTTDKLADDEITINENTTIAYPIKLKEYTVTYKGYLKECYVTVDGERVTVPDSDPTAPLPNPGEVTETVRHGKTAALKTAEGKTIDFVLEDTIRWVRTGWVPEGQSAPVDPTKTPVTGNITYVAMAGQTYAITYAPGEHSANKFGTAKASFTELSADYTWANATLVLAAADLDNGKPKAETGYTFVGWKSSLDETDNKVTYTSLDELYATTPPQASAVFTAIWEETSQTINFASGDRAATASTTPVVAKTGADFTTPAAPEAQTGWEFNGWKGTLNGQEVTLEANKSYKMHATPAETTFTAQWKPATATIDFAVADGQAAMGKVSRGYTGIDAGDGDLEVVAYATPNAGYKFVGWTSKNGTDISTWYDGTLTDKTNRNYGLLTVQQQGGYYLSDTYTATFAPDDYSVTFDFGAKADAALKSGYSAPAQSIARGGSPSYALGTDVTYEENPGYHLLGWSYVMQEEGDKLAVTTRVVPGPIEDPSEVEIKGNTVFTAVYGTDSAYVSFVGNGADGGDAQAPIKKVTVDGVERDAVVGDIIALPEATTMTRSGYEFAGWGKTADADYKDPSALVRSVTLVGIDGDNTNANKVYALWKPASVSIEYVVNDEVNTGTGSKIDRSGVFGQDVPAAENTFTAPSYVRNGITVPGTARSFTGWSPVANGESEYFFKPGDKIPAALIGSANDDKPFRLYAQWEDRSFKVTYNDGVSGLMTDMDKHNIGTDANKRIGDIVTIQANEYERTGWEFKQWLITEGTGSSLVTTVVNGAGSYKLKGLGDVTVTASWERTDASDNAKILVNRYDYVPSYKSNSAQNSPDDAFSMDALANTYITDSNLKFEGWYASANLARTHNAADRITDGTTYAEILAKYYSDQSADKLPDAAASYWEDGAITQAFKDASQVVIPVYMGVSMQSYDVKFVANSPTGLEADAGAPMADQKIVVGSGDALNANTYKVDGYRFLGWQLGNAHSVYTKENYNQLSTRYVDKYSTANGELVTNYATGTSITLYGAWEKIEDNTITYVLHYAGDGVQESGADVQLGKAEGLAYDEAITLPAGASAPTTYSAERSDVTFEGWYTAKNTMNAQVLAGTRANMGSSLVSQIAEAAGATPDANGTYNLTLYAKWSNSGASVVYDKNGGEGDLASAITSTTLQSGQAATVDLIPNNLTKVGYTANGWAENASGATTGLTQWTFAAETPSGTQKKLYANFTPKQYNVSYDIYTVTNYNGKTLPAQGASGEITGVQNLSWDSGKVISDAITTDPTKDGYDFRGWYATNPQDDAYAVRVQPNWTVSDLRSALARSAGTPDEVSDDNTNGVTIYAKWEPKTYSVDYDLGGGTRPGGNLPTKKSGIEYSWSTADGTATGEKLVIPASEFERTGFTNPTWYVDSAKTKMLQMGAGGSVTMESIISQWREANPTATKLPSTFTLYVGWTEKTVEITFNVAANGLLQMYGEDTLPAGTTTKTYVVGVDSGLVYENGVATNNQLADVLAGAITGFKVTGWTKDGEELTDGVTVNDDGTAKVSVVKNVATKLYEAATYTATIGASDTTYTVAYFKQAADGSYGLTPDAEVTGLEGAVDSTVKASQHITSSFFADHAAAAAGLGIVSGELEGFTLDQAKSVDVVVASSGTILKVYFARDTHKVEFASAFQGGAPADKPQLPMDRANMLYGSEYAFDGAYTASNMAAKAPAGYAFAGWYIGSAAVADADAADVPATAYDQVSGDKFNIPAYDVVATAVYTKTQYNVTFATNVVQENDHTAAAPESDAKFTTTTSETYKLDRGQKLTSLTGGLQIKLTDSSTHTDMILGTEDATPVIVGEFNGNTAFITWEYTMNGATLYTADPTSVEILGDTTFQAVASTARVVSYMPGEHGTFTTFTDDTTPENGTRRVGIDRYYNIADYKFPLTNTSVVEQDSNNVNQGLPKGEPGWKFAGWKVESVTPTGGLIVVDTTTAAAQAQGEARVNAGLDDAQLKDLVFSATLTAQWEPTQSTLVYDPGDDAVEAITTDEGAHANWHNNLSQITASTYDSANPEGTEVTLPGADYVTRDGFKLAKWTWTDDKGTTDASDDMTYEYAPGDKFRMPGKLSNETTTLTAVWEEDTTTFKYKVNDPKMGTIDITQQVVGVWSGKIQNTDKYIGGTEGVGGATPTANGDFEFSRWYVVRNGVEQPLGEGVWYDATTKRITPLRNAGTGTGLNTGKYVGDEYIVDFKGNTHTVQFAANNGSVTLKDDKNAEVASKQVNASYGTTVKDLNYTVETAPTAGYKKASDDFWSYVMTDSDNKVVATGNTSDPLSITIKGNTVFTANYVENAGGEDVKFWMDNTMKEQYGDTKSRTWKGQILQGIANPVKPGYNFVDWRMKVGSDEKILGQSDTSTLEQLYGNTTAASYDAYATWTEKTGYTLAFNTNNGVFKTGDSTQTAMTLSGLSWTSEINGSETLKVPNPTRTGYQFTGWYTLPGDGGKLVIGPNGEKVKYSDIAGTNDNPENAITLYAHWSNGDYYVIYVSEDYNEATGAGTVYSGPTKVGYEATTLNINQPSDATAEASNWWKGWKYTVDRGNNYTALGAKTSVKDLDINSRDSSKPNMISTNPEYNGAFIIYADWEPYVEWTITYHPMESDDNGRTWTETPFSDVEDLATNKAIYDKLKVTLRGKAGDVVNPFTVAGYNPYTYVIPGYKFDLDAMTYTGNEGYKGSKATSATLEQVFVDTLVDGQTVDFDIYVCNKKNFTVTFDLNGGQAYTDKGYTHTATPQETELQGAYPDETNKIFGSDWNVPAYLDEDEVTFLPYKEPVRKGFKFDGWFNLQLPDSTNLDEYIAKTGVTPVEAKADMLLGELALNAKGEWYEPDDGTFTLYAKWTEEWFETSYAIASGDAVGGMIDYNVSNHNWITVDEGGAKLTDKVSAASGVSEHNGAVAQAKPGYHFNGWYVRSNVGDVTEVNTVPMTGASIDMVSNAIDSAVEAAVANADSDANVAATIAKLEAADALNMTASADTSYKLYSMNPAIVPGASATDNLFGAEPGSGEQVEYLATFAENEEKAITYDLNGGSGKIEPTKARVGLEVAVTDVVPTRNGYAFEGWKDAAGKTYNAGDKFTMTEAGLQLTAQWKVLTHELEIYAGADRWATSRMISDSTAKLDGASYKGVIVVSGENGRFPDALSAAGLSGVLGYPMIVIRGSELDAGGQSIKNIQAIKKKSPNGKLNLVIVGGTAAVSKATENRLKSAGGNGSVKRLGGADRYETNKLVYEYGQKNGGWNKDYAFLATGANFPDALAIGPFLGANKVPIALTAPTKNSLDSYVKTILKGGKNVFVLGGDAAVPDKLFNDAKKTNSTAKRIAGKTRYETGAMIAEWEISKGMSVEGAGFATGANFADALGSASLLSRTNSVLFLVNSDDTSQNANTVKVLKAAAKDLIPTKMRVFGGTAAVKASIYNTVTKAVSWETYTRNQLK